MLLMYVFITLCGYVYWRKGKRERKREGGGEEEEEREREREGRREYDILFRLVLVCIGVPVMWSHVSTGRGQV